MFKRPLLFTSLLVTFQISAFAAETGRLHLVGVVRHSINVTIEDAEVEMDGEDFQEVALVNIISNSDKAFEISKESLNPESGDDIIYTITTK